MDALPRWWSSPSKRDRRTPAQSKDGGTLAEKVPEQPDPFVVWLFARAGLDANAYSPRFLNRRISACLRVLRVTSVPAAMAALEARPGLIQAAVDAILIGVSSFFRDGSVFKSLRDSVLPTLLEQRQGLRVCSMGCSDGHELYSIAMLLDEFDALRHSQLLGVDCRPEALARAQAGWFERAEMEELPADYRTRYFQSAGSRSRVTGALLASTQWEQGNCLDWAYSRQPWDLFLFRNVAIYLRRDLMEGLWPRIAGGLRKGGILVTGKAEQPPRKLGFSRLHPCIYAAQH